MMILAVAEPESITKAKAAGSTTAVPKMIEVNELSDMFNIDGFASYCDTKTGERKMPG